MTQKNQRASNVYCTGRYNTRETMIEQIDIPDSFPGPGAVSGKRVVITGASRGLGALLSHAFSRAGASVALVARTERDLKAVAQALPGSSLVLSGDVTDEDFNEAVADAAVSEWGGIDAWICNAGISPIVAGPREPDASTWRQVIEDNLTGSFLGGRGPAHGRRRTADLHRIGPGRTAAEGVVRLQRVEGRAGRRRQGPRPQSGPRRHPRERRGARMVRVTAGRRMGAQPQALRRHHGAHRAAALGHVHRPRRRLPVPGLRRLRLHHRYRAQRRRRILVGMTATQRVVAIIGEGGALGAAVSQQIAGEPATDLMLSDVSAASLEAAVAGVAAEGGSVETMLADVSDYDQVEAVITRTVERFGRLDVLISNAGILCPNGRIHNLRTEDWERAFRVNLLGAVNGIRAAVGVMRPQGSGSIILTASVSGLTAWSHAAPYCATKAAVIQLAKVAAVEYARDGIRVNCVCPGTFRSAIHDGLPPEALDAVAERHPLGLGTAADLVGAYSYLASDAARWTTGSALVVDGGYSAP